MEVVLTTGRLGITRCSGLLDVEPVVSEQLFIRERDVWGSHINGNFQLKKPGAFLQIRMRLPLRVLEHVPIGFRTREPPPQVPCVKRAATGTG